MQFTYVKIPWHFFLKNNCSFFWKSRLISWFPCGLPGDRYIMEPYTKYNLRTGQTGFPDQGDALKVQENANSVAMPNPLPPPFQQIPEPMITGCKYDGKPGWQHIPRMSQEVDLWWAILEHGGGGSEGGTWALSHRMSQEVELVEYIFGGAGALSVRKLWKMRRSSCQVERLRPFAYLWENTSLEGDYLHWPGISWHSCSGDKCFYSQAASPSQTSHATITLDSAAWSIFTDPFYNWQTSLDRNILSTSTRSTENSLSVVTTYFRTLSAKSIVPVWGDQLSWKPDWGGFAFVTISMTTTTIILTSIRSLEARVSTYWDNNCCAIV